MEESHNPEEFEALTEEQRGRVVRWIHAHLLPSRHELPQASLRLCREFGEVGFTLSHGAFKGALVAAGFAPVNAGAVSWRIQARRVTKCPKELGAQW